MHRAIYLVAAMLAVCPGTAQAQAVDDRYWSIPTTTTPDLEAALAAAREHWGTDPPCGPVSFRLIPSHRAIAGGVAWTHICAIDIERGEHHFEDACELVVHEIGHLHGLGHGDPGPPEDPDPFYDPALAGTVMDYRVLDTHGGVPACDREHARREHVTQRWWDLRAVAVARRRHCRTLPRRCRLARATATRARALRRAITWAAW